MGDTEAGRVYVTVGYKDNEVAAGLQKTRAALDKAGSDAGTSFTAGFSKSLKGGNFSNVGKEMADALVAPMTQSFGALGGVATELAGALGPVGIAVGVITAATGALAIGARNAASSWQDLMSDVERTTGIEGAALDALGDRAMAMAVKYGKSKEALGKSATVAGSLGVGDEFSNDLMRKQKEIMDFVEVSSKMETAWGMNADRAAGYIGTIGGVTRDAMNEQRKAAGKSEMSWADYANRLGSTVDVLGNKFNTSEEKMVEALSSSSLTSMMSQLKPSEDAFQKWEALAAVMTSTGSTGADAGQAIGDALRYAKKDSEDFMSKMLGVSKLDFQKMIGKDQVGTLKELADKINALPLDQQEAAYAKFGDTGSKALKALATNQKMYNDALTASSSAWEKAVSLDEGFQKKMGNESTARARMFEAMGVAAVKLGNLVLPVFTTIENSLADIIDLGTKAGESLYGAGEGVVGAVQGAWTGYENWANTTFSGARDWLQSKTGLGAKDAAKNAGEEMKKEVAKGTADGLKEGAEKGAPAAAATVSEEMWAKAEGWTRAQANDTKYAPGAGSPTTGWYQTIGATQLAGKYTFTYGLQNRYVAGGTAGGASLMLPDGKIVDLSGSKDPVAAAVAAVEEYTKQRMTALEKAELAGDVKEALRLSLKVELPNLWDTDYDAKYFIAKWGAGNPELLKELGEKDANTYRNAYVKSLKSDDPTLKEAMENISKALNGEAVDKGLLKQSIEYATSSGIFDGVAEADVSSLRAKIDANLAEPFKLNFDISDLTTQQWLNQNQWLWKSSVAVGAPIQREEAVPLHETLIDLQESADKGDESAKAQIVAYNALTDELQKGVKADPSIIDSSISVLYASDSPITKLAVFQDIGNIALATIKESSAGTETHTSKIETNTEGLPKSIEDLAASLGYRDQGYEASSGNYAATRAAASGTYPSLYSAYSNSPYTGQISSQRVGPYLKQYLQDQGLFFQGGGLTGDYEGIVYVHPHEAIIPVDEIPGLYGKSNNAPKGSMQYWSGDRWFEDYPYKITPPTSYRWSQYPSAPNVAVRGNVPQSWLADEQKSGMEWISSEVRALQLQSIGKSQVLPWFARGYQDQPKWWSDYATSLSPQYESVWTAKKGGEVPKIGPDDLANAKNQYIYDPREDACIQVSEGAGAGLVTNDPYWLKRGATSSGGDQLSQINDNIETSNKRLGVIEANTGKSSRTLDTIGASSFSPYGLTGKASGLSPVATSSNLVVGIDPSTGEFMKYDPRTDTCEGLGFNAPPPNLVTSDRFLLGLSADSPAWKSVEEGGWGGQVATPATQDLLDEQNAARKAAEETAKNTKETAKNTQQIYAGVSNLVAGGVAGGGSRLAGWGNPTIGGSYGSAYGDWYTGGTAGLSSMFGTAPAASWMNEAAREIGGASAMQFAEGGSFLVDQPTLFKLPGGRFGVAGEAGEEVIAILPLNNPSRMREILADIVPMIGARPFADGGHTWASAAGMALKAQGRFPGDLAVGDTIHLSVGPIYASAGMDEDKLVDKIVKKVAEKFNDAKRGH